MSLQRIGNYEVLGELGRGGMGVVYRGVDSFIKRPVAIKTIYLSEIQEDHERQFLKERLYREAQSAGILSHPNIVTIYQIGEQDDITYIVMEFVEGKNLAQLLRSPEKPSVELLLSIFEQTAAGLDHAHAQGVIHRDIKPANIIVRSDGVAKITDFGVAKIASQTVTRTGMTLGTPHFMAPEQIQGKAIDGRADQYSLGVVIYEIFTGKKPFTADSMTTLIFKIVTDSVDPKRDNPSLPDAAAEVLKRALAKDAGDRFPSCQALVQAFRAAIGLPSGVAAGYGAGIAIPSRASYTQGALPSSPSTVQGTAPLSTTRTGQPPTIPATPSFATGPQTPTPTPTPQPPQSAPPPVASKVAPAPAASSQPSGFASLPQNVEAPVSPQTPTPGPYTGVPKEPSRSNKWLVPVVAAVGLAVLLGIFGLVKLLDTTPNSGTNQIASSQKQSAGKDSASGLVAPGQSPAATGSTGTGIGSASDQAGTAGSSSTNATAASSSPATTVGAAGSSAGPASAVTPAKPGLSAKPGETAKPLSPTSASSGTISSQGRQGSLPASSKPAQTDPRKAASTPTAPSSEVVVPDPGVSKPAAVEAPKPVAQPVFTPPKPIVRVPAIYPAEARRDGVSGSVLLQAVVNEAGQPTSVNVIRGIRPDLDQAAKEALAKWRFQPGTADGKPVESRINVEIAFNLVQDQRKPISLKNP
jgi:serine/threonine-protein kinase